LRGICVAQGYQFRLQVSRVMHGKHRRYPLP
jgi:hypothetical protein